MSLADNCNTLITNGFHLEDLPQIRARVREAVRLHAQDNSYTDFPGDFNCSHCGNQHTLTPEEIRDALYRGPGQVDFVASNNEFKAMMEKIPVASVGDDYSNGISTGSDYEVSQAINSASAAEPEPAKKSSSKNALKFSGNE